MSYYYSIGLACAIVAGACPTQVQAQNHGWRPLFDGKTFNGWRGLGSLRWRQRSRLSVAYSSALSLQATMRNVHTSVTLIRMRRSF